MGRPEVMDQRFPGLMLQILQVGGRDREGLLLGLGLQGPRLIAQHPEHHILHRYRLKSHGHSGWFALNGRVLWMTGNRSTLVTVATFLLQRADIPAPRR